MEAASLFIVVLTMFSIGGTVGPIVRKYDLCDRSPRPRRHEPHPKPSGAPAHDEQARLVALNDSATGSCVRGAVSFHRCTLGLPRASPTAYRRRQPPARVVSSVAAH
jgi:hypothetical protein